MRGRHHRRKLTKANLLDAKTAIQIQVEHAMIMAIEADTPSAAYSWAREALRYADAYRAIDGAAWVVRRFMSPVRQAMLDAMGIIEGYESGDWRPA